MKSIIFILLSIAIFSGCGITNIEYNSEQVKIPKYIQKVENKHLTIEEKKQIQIINNIIGDEIIKYKINKVLAND